MYPISEAMKERFLSGQRQIARLTVNNNPYDPYKEEYYYSHFGVEGQNIFTREGETDGKYLNQAGNLVNNSGYATSDYLPVEPLKRYVTNIPTQDVGRYHAWYDENKDLIFTEHWKQECFISPSNARYFRASYIKSNTPADTTYMRIEVGTVVEGLVDVATGVLTVTKGFISDMSKYYWSVASSTYPYIFASNYISGAYNVLDGAERNKNIGGSAYRPSPTTDINQSMLNGGILLVGNASQNNSSFRARDNNYENNIDGFRQSIVGLQLIFPYKEPLTYQLTPTEVKTFLGANNIWTDTGNVSVTYRNISGEAVTVSGERVTFSDGAKDVPVDSLVTDINYTQDLNGYDYPWVGGGGKNIANTEGTENKSTQTVFYTFDLKAGTYTLSADISNTGTAGVGVRIIKGNTIFVTIGYATDSTPTRFSGSFTLNSDETDLRMAIMGSASGYVGTAKNIMIESGTSATDYAPYENICPIEGWESATIHQTGKNMFDGGYLNGYYDDSGRFRQSSERYVAYLFDRFELDNNLIVEGGKDYVISFDTIGIRGKDFYTLEFDKETGEYIRGTKTLRFTQQAGKTIPRHITVRPYNDSILVWYWDAGNGNYEYDEVEFEEITMVTLLSQMEEDVVIRETDIVEGSLSVNRYCTTGKSAMIGSCVASEMNVILNNENGKYNDVNFIGKDISVEVGTLDANDRPDFMPIGIFQVDDSPKKLEHISLTALDRMMLLEKPFEPVAIPTTIYWLYQDICERTNVRRKTTELWNESYVIDIPPENVQTYRDVLSCLCEITGTCAFFDWDGRLCLEWFSQDEPTIVLTTSNRINSDLAEESVQITGVEVKAGEGTYLAGTDAYTLSVAQNPLVTRDEQDLADALYEHLGWLAYRPFSATVLPMPYIYPMDMATFVDRDGNESLVAITDWTFRLNRNTELRGRGESSQQASFKKKYGIGENGADIDQALGILRDTIIKNAEIINQQMETIERTLHGQYEALSSEFGSYRNETDAKITANAEGITQAYTNIEEIDSKYGVAITDTNEAIVQVADGAVATNTKFREVTEAYIKSGKLYYEGTTPVYGVAVGQLTYETIDGEQLIKRSGVYSVFTSNELAFYIDDVKVAYMRNKKLYINEAEFVSAINVGRYKLEDGTNGFTIKYGG